MTAGVFAVFISGKLVVTVNTAKAAWKVIGRQPFYVTWQVHDEHGNVRPEFIPF